MNELELVTDHVSPDEKCWFYKEVNEPDVVGVQRRYEVIRVVRSDRMYTYRLDLGKPTKDDGIRIPCYNEHTVGEAREICAKLKLRPYDKLDMVGVNRIRTGNGNYLV